MVGSKARVSERGKVRVCKRDIGIRPLPDNVPLSLSPAHYSPGVGTPRGYPHVMVSGTPTLRYTGSGVGSPGGKFQMREVDEPPSGSLGARSLGAWPGFRSRLDHLRVVYFPST